MESLEKQTGYEPRGASLPGPPITPGNRAQTFRAGIIPSPTSSSGGNRTATTGTAKLASQPQQLKRNPSNSTPQTSSKKSRNSTPKILAPSTSTSLANPKNVIGKDAPVDYRLLLLSLADQYILAGRSHSGFNSNERCKLIATALGCLETLLKEKQAWKLHPRQEATIMLKYSSLLYEETENDSHAETMLSRGIVLCDRHRFYDLKYSMQYLSAKYMFRRSSPKAMDAYVETVMKDAETYDHVVWIYAFLFLRISLLLPLPSKTYAAVILRDLAKVSAIAKRRRDPSVGAIAATLEALVHIRGQTTNWLDDAQHAIAAARSQQLSVSGPGMTHLETIIYILDIACSLDPYDHKQSAQKMQAMHAYFKSTGQVKQDHNVFSVPVSSHDAQLTLETTGVFERTDTGQLHLMIAWLSSSELYVLGSLISGLAYWHKNPKDGQSEIYFRDCLKCLEDVDAKSRDRSGQLLAAACAAGARRRVLYLHTLLYQGLVQADREDWRLASVSLAKVTASYRTCEEVLNPTTKRVLSSALAYLTAIIAQGTGEFSKAVGLYTAPPLSLPSYTEREPANPVTTLSILASINTLLITHPPSHPQHASVPAIFERLNPYFRPGTPFTRNPHLAAAYTFAQSVILATSPHLLATANTTIPTTTTTSTSTTTSSPHPQVQILPTKQLLQRSLTLSKSVGNTQLLTMTLTFVHHAFFSGQVGKQAFTAARSARATAKEAGRGLWLAVCDGVVGGVMERMGMKEEAEAIFEEGRSVTITAALRSG